MYKSRGNRNFRIMKEILRWTVTLILCLFMAGSAFAESAQPERSDGQREQWVFLLASPDDDSECRFFVNPSLGGYEAVKDTDIRLTMAISSKSYEIALHPSDIRSGWYISEVYNIAASAWKMDYEVTLEMTEGGSLLTEEMLTQADMAACWPEVSDGSLKLEKDSSGQFKNNEFEGSQWIDMTENPLFKYRIDGQENCEAVLDGNGKNIRIISAGNGGSFILAAEDPAGGRREAKVNIVVAGQTGTGLTGGIAAIVLIVVILIIVIVLKKKKSAPSGIHADGSRNQSGRVSEKQRKIMEAGEDVSRVWQRTDTLVSHIRTLQQEIEQTGGIAEERVRQEGAASAYSLTNIREMMTRAEELKEDPSYENLRKMRDILKEIGSQLLRMQGNAKIEVPKNGLAVENPKNYIDSSSRRDILSTIEADEKMTKAMASELSAILGTLKEIAYHEEIPFSANIDIRVVTADGSRQYNGRRVARDTYGTSMPGVFSLDSIQLLSREGSLMTLPEILNHETGIRLFAVDENRIRAIAMKPVMIREDKKQQIIDFKYDQDAVINLEDAEITLHFRR